MNDTDGAITISTLNDLPLDDAEVYCGGFFENSPWIVRKALTTRPFRSVDQFHLACVNVVARSGRDAQLALIRAHPDLVGRLAQEGRLGRESTSEQAAAGLDVLTTVEIDAFERNNAAYRDRFDFPFVICARNNRKEAILAAFPIRLENPVDIEIETALSEIGEIARLRMYDAIKDDDRSRGPTGGERAKER